MVVEVSQIEIIGRIVLAVVLGGIIGFEREIHNRPAGLRTNILICLGATLATITSITSFYATNADPARVAAGVITGIGFLGAGTIMQAKSDVKGLTTAASIWLVATIGLAVGAGFYLGAIITSGIAFFILSFKNIERRI